jgi:hypothetical protein
MFDAQHGPHRLGVGALFERMVDPLSGWNSRTESFVVGTVIVAAAICALWLKKRLYGTVSICDLVIPAILFIPGQWATWFNVANFAHGPFPLLLVLLYCVSWTLRRRVVRYSLILFINFLSIYTGFGIFLGVLTPILLLLDYWTHTPQNRLPKVYFVSALLLSVASLASFFVGYKFWPASQCFSFQLQSPVSYLAFVALMFANFFGLKDVALPVQVIGIMIVAAVLVPMTVCIWLLFRQKTTSFAEAVRDKNLIVACLTAYTLLFCAFTAYGRLCQGLNTALAPRYVIYLEPAVLGVYFFLLTVRSAPARKVLLSGFSIGVIAASFYVDRTGMWTSRHIKEGWKTCYLQTQNIEKCNEVIGFPIYPNTENLEKKLEFLKKRHLNLFLDKQVP